VDVGGVGVKMWSHVLGNGKAHCLQGSSFPNLILPD
jgi:hypothetical protein